MLGPTPDLIRVKLIARSLNGKESVLGVAEVDPDDYPGIEEYGTLYIAGSELAPDGRVTGEIARRYRLYTFYTEEESLKGVARRFEWTFTDPAVHPWKRDDDVSKIDRADIEAEIRRLSREGKIYSPPTVITTSTPVASDPETMMKAELIIKVLVRMMGDKIIIDEFDLEAAMNDSRPLQTFNSVDPWKLVLKLEGDT